MRHIVAVIFGRCSLPHQPNPWGEKDGVVREAFLDKMIAKLRLKGQPEAGLEKDNLISHQGNKVLGQSPRV